MFTACQTYNFFEATTCPELKLRFGGVFLSLVLQLIIFSESSSTTSSEPLVLQSPAPLFHMVLQSTEREHHWPPFRALLTGTLRVIQLIIPFRPQLLMLFSAQSLQCSQPLVRWYADLQWYKVRWYKVQVIYSSEPCGTQVSGGGTVVQWYSRTVQFAVYSRV